MDNLNELKYLWVREKILQLSLQYTFDYSFHKEIWLKYLTCFFTKIELTFKKN